jgi:hypothetical protein
MEAAGVEHHAGTRGQDHGVGGSAVACVDELEESAADDG